MTIEARSDATPQPKRKQKQTHTRTSNEIHTNQQKQLSFQLKESTKTFTFFLKLHCLDALLKLSLNDFLPTLSSKTTKKPYFKPIKKMSSYESHQMADNINR